MPAPPCGSYGDVTGDGNVSSTDMMYIAQYLVGSRTLTPDQLDRADVNGDGKVTQEDIDLIASYVTGAITTFPVCGTTPPPEITCNSPTPHFTSGCSLLRNYDADKDGIICNVERDKARFDRNTGSITDEECDFVIAAENAGSINNLCPGCFEETLPVICTPGEKVCIDERTKNVCKDDGTGWTSTLCGRDHECIDGECVYVAPGPVCTPGETRCYDARSYERCNYDGSGWDRVPCPSGYICIGGECIRSAEPPICTPGEKRCYNETTVEVCKYDGTAWDRTTCQSGYTCIDGQCVKSTPAPPPGNETRTTSLTEGNHSIQVSLSGYDTLNATINVSSTGVTCTVGPCNTQGPPGVTTSGWTVTTYLKSATTVSDVCSWINSIGGWRNIQWASHVLEAYYVYIGASGHSVGFSPVTWNDVLGLYYYYINDPTAGNGKIGCGT